MFHACAFKDLVFRRSAHSHAATCAAVQRHLERHLVCSALLHTVSEQLAGQTESEVTGLTQPKPMKHTPLLQRATEPALQERLSKYGARLMIAGATGMDEDIS